MKRNMDLVRQLVFAIEELPNGFVRNKKLSVEGYSEEEIGYHLSLMIEAGLIHGVDISHALSSSPTGVATCN